jgi:tetratricopeptide (TPR) repeat protein
MRLSIKAFLAVSCAALLAAPLARADVDDDVRGLQQQWERIKYRKPQAEQEKAFAALAQTAAAVRTRYADRAEPAIWYGIIVASHAGAKGGFGALSLAKEAKQALEHALSIDPKALSGSAYTSLGSLYYQVPGWPIGFGDDAKARELLERALRAPPRPGRPLADEGRRAEVKEILAKLPAR